MPRSNYPKRGQRASKNSQKQERREDIKSAAENTKWCPTCGKAMGTGSAVGSAGGGG